MTLRTHSTELLAAGLAARMGTPCVALMTMTMTIITPCHAGPGRTRAT